LEIYVFLKLKKRAIFKKGFKLKMNEWGAYTALGNNAISFADAPHCLNRYTHACVNHTEFGLLSQQTAT
jgi:hypothetical protein